MKSTSQNDFQQLNDLLQLWKERLAFLSREQAIVASSTEQFELRKRAENPLRYSLNALWYQVPVVYELNSKQLYFYEQSKDWVDQFTGEIVWKELRQITKKTLLP